MTIKYTVNVSLIVKLYSIHVCIAKYFLKYFIEISLDTFMSENLYVTSLFKPLSINISIITEKMKYVKEILDLNFIM